MNLTIDKVYAKAREWQGDKGTAAYVKVLFSDGSEGEYRSTPDKAQEHIDALNLLVGKPSEFEIDASKEREYQGVIQRKIVSYPGKPVGGGFGGGGGGRNFTPAWANTQEGERYVQERTDRRTALMQATALHIAKGESHVVDIADALYKWLRASDSVSTPTPANTSAMPQNVSQPTTRPVAPVSVGGVWEGEGNCPGCNAPSGKPHGSKCTGKGQDEE